MRKILTSLSLLAVSLSAFCARYTYSFDDMNIGTAFTFQGNAGGEATVTASPSGQGKALKVKYGEWGQQPIFDITLPQGITLGECTSMNVKLYIPSADNEEYAHWKQMQVYIDGQLVFKNVNASGGDDYPFQGDKDTWFTKTLSVDQLSSAPLQANNFSLALGFNDNRMTFYIGEISFSYQLNIGAPVLPEQGAWYTGHYRNLFAEAGYTDQQIQQRIDDLWATYFEGDKENERLYYESGSDMAYILDVNNNDVRSEGMSYGMMLCVQLDRQKEFNALWKWAKTYMQHPSDAEHYGYFAWQCDTNGNKKDKNPASDGEEYFITSLMLASNRWGDGQGIFNYSKEANYILEMSAEKGDKTINPYSSSTPLFDPDQMQVVFVPFASAAKFSDPSYHLPAFYELWAEWADKDNDFYRRLAAKSREMFPRFAHPQTGLMPDYSDFDGSPHMGDGDHADFLYDAWRCIMNMSIDYAWFKPAGNPYTQLVNRQYAFFKSQGITEYKSVYMLDGQPKNGNSDHSPGLVACNASGALACDSKDAWLFVENFFDTPIPTGKFRYYDGCLYFLNWLNCAGRYRIYRPGDNAGGITDITADDTVNITLTLRAGSIVSSADTDLLIYALPSGICVSSTHVTAGRETSVDDLPSGLYVAKAGASVLKFRK